MTTAASFIGALAAVSVSGVAKNYGTSQPLSIPPANLPAQFVRLPTAENRPWVAEGGPTIGTLRAEVVVVVKPIAQGIPRDVSEPLAMLDALRTAVSGADVALSKPNYTIRVTIFEFDSIQYWGLVAEVSATG